MLYYGFAKLQIKKIRAPFFFEKFDRQPFVLRSDYIPLYFATASAQRSPSMAAETMPPA